MKLELSYQTTGPCYEQEEDKEKEILEISRIIWMKIEGIMEAGMETDGQIEIGKNEDKIIKHNMKTWRKENNGNELN